MENIDDMVVFPPIIVMYLARRWCWTCRTNFWYTKGREQRGDAGLEDIVEGENTKTEGGGESWHTGAANADKEF